MVRPVLTKRDFVRRYAAGEFGNASPTWNTIEDWLADPARVRFDSIHIRNRIAGGWTWYDVPYGAMEAFYRSEVLRYLRPQDVYFSAMAPSEKTTLQGEVQRTPAGLLLTFNQQPTNMREGFRLECKTLFGLSALLLLQQHLSAVSMDWMHYLLDTYVDHVVEFSAYSTLWGTLPGYNTVFWEVRCY